MTLKPYNIKFKDLHFISSISKNPDDVNSTGSNGIHLRNFMEFKLMIK